MIPLLLRGMSGLTLLLSLTLGAIVAQPRDDAALHDFFAPLDGCAAPCFLGIRPGLTTVQQAIRVLQANPWVTAIRDAGRESPSHPQDYTNIVWDWSGRQPAFLGDSADSPPSLHVNNGVVQYIRLVTRIPYGDAWLSIGAPTTQTLIVGSSDSAMRSASYLGGSLVFDSQVTCPLNPVVEWSAPIAITYSDGSPTAYSKPDFHIDRAFYRSSCPS